MPPLENALRRCLDELLQVPPEPDELLERLEA
jgi:hypothetical protein